MDYNINKIMSEVLFRSSAEHELFLEKIKNEKVPESEYLEHLGFMKGVEFAISTMIKINNGDI